MYIVIELFVHLRLVDGVFFFSCGALMTFLLSRIFGASDEKTAYPSGKTLMYRYLPGMVVLIMHCQHFLFVWYTYHTLFSYFHLGFVELSLHFVGLPDCHLCLQCVGSGLSPEWESNFAIIWKVEQCAMYIVIPLFGNFRLLCMEFYFDLSEASMTFLLSRIIAASDELTAYPSGKTLTCWYLPSMVVLIMHWRFLFVWYVGYDCSMNMFSCLGNCGSTILYWQWTRKTTE